MNLRNSREKNRRTGWPRRESKPKPVSAERLQLFRSGIFSSGNRSGPNRSANLEIETDVKTEICFGAPEKRSRTFFSAEKVSPISIFFEITRLDFLNEEQETIFGPIRSSDPLVCDLGVLEIESDSPLAFLLSNHVP